MSFDFPNSPTTGQQFSPTAGVSYIYNGYAWDLLSGPTAAVTPTKVTVITASGTFTPMAGMTFAIVECVGGGGGGGGSPGVGGGSGSASCGGGSGGYSRRLLTAAQVGASQTITIGGAGAGGVAGSAAGTGGDTSFGALCIAKGGGGATGISGAGTGGSISGAVGDLTSAGVPGVLGIQLTTSLGCVSGGDGGSSTFGGGGLGAVVTTVTTTAGGNASNYGSGGGGAASLASAGTANGGNGSAGVCIITEYGGSAPQAVTVPVIKTITASGTYTPSPGLVAAIVEVVGGGAGGYSPQGNPSNTYYNFGPGGGAGAFAKKVLTAAQIGVSQTITIGAGGAGGTSPTAAGAAGGAGGDTSFGSLVIAKGAPVSSGPWGGGLGGPIAGSVGDIVVPGQPGRGGGSETPQSMGIAVGGGGNGVYGAGGVEPVWTPSSTSGAPGLGYGAGGGGGVVGTSGVANSGGAGSPGVCIVTEFIQQGGTAAAALPGARVLIQTQTVGSAVASVDFVTGIDTTYDEYELVYYNLFASADGNLTIRISQDGGATFKAASTDYLWQFFYSGTATPTTITGVGALSNSITVSSTNVAAAAAGGNGTLKFYLPSNTTSRKLFQIDTIAQGGGGYIRHVGSGAYNTDNNAINGIRFLLSAGNISQGTFNLYGIKK